MSIKIYSIPDLLEHRAHLTRNIMLADQKAASLITAYGDHVTNSKDKAELYRLFNSVLFPVVISETDSHNPFDLSSLNQADLILECETLKNIVTAKYGNISKMFNIIRKSLTWLKAEPVVKKSVESNNPQFNKKNTKAWKYGD